MANETDPDYEKVVFQLDDRNRIVLCTAGIQWILQNRGKKAVEVPTKGCYYAKSFVRTRKGLQSLIERMGYEVPTSIANLPEIL